MRTALLLGFPVHVRTITQFVQEHAQNWRLIPGGVDLGSRNLAVARLPFVDAVIIFGGPQPDALIGACARRLRKPVAVIWAGTDVLQAAADPERTTRVRTHGYRHFACSEGLAGELAELGISATALPLVVARLPDAIAPLPEQFTVLGYAPGSQSWLYGTDILLEAAQRLPSIKFVVIGDRERASPTQVQNVTFHGWLEDVNPVIDSASVVVRPTRHDGMPIMVIDALARGRHVIWSRSMEGALRAETADELVAQLTLLEAQHRQGMLRPNEVGMRAVERTFSPAAVTRTFENFLNDLTKSHRARRPRRAVVSGKPEVVAQFLNQAAREAPDWEIHAAIGRSRSERVDDALAMLAAERWISLGSDSLDPLVAGVASVIRRKPTAFEFQPGKLINGVLRHRHRHRAQVAMTPDEWRAFDACHAAPTFFARPAWALALEKAFPDLSAQPMLFNLMEGEAILPFMRSGRRFRSIDAMPLGTYTIPLTPDGTLASRRLAGEIVQHLIESRVDDLRCTFWPMANYESVEPCRRDEHQASVIDLRDGTEAALARFKGVARRMAGQAVRKGVSCGREQSAIDTYYGLLEESAKRWGLEAPHIPRRLFEAVVAFGGEDVEIWIARYRGEAIAGGVLFYGSEEAFFWSAALRADYADLRPSNLLNVEMIKAAGERGMKWYNLGASEGLGGVARFKASLGAQLVDYASMSWQSAFYGRYRRLRALMSTAAS